MKITNPNRIITYLKGFTLVELIIVVVVGIILYGIATSVGSGLGVRDVQSQAERLASDLRFMRSMAMQLSLPVRINFVSDDGYEFRTVDDATSTLLWQRTNAGSDISIASGMTMTYTGLGTPEMIVFDAKGMPYSAVSGSEPASLLTADATITVAKGSDTREVIVVPETGVVLVENE